MSDGIDSNIVVAFVNTGKNKYSNEAFKMWQSKVQESNLGATYEKYDDIPTLYTLLSNPRVNLDYIIIPIDALDSFEFGNSIELLNSLKILARSTMYRSSDGKTKLRNVKILASVTSDCSSEKIKYIAKLVDGLCISYSSVFSWDRCIQDQRRILAGDLTMPPELRAIMKTSRTLNINSAISLTARQRQVFTLIATRGASNKVIANILNISESMVKLHVGAILRKHGLKNRTQLAVYAKNAQL